MVEVCFQEKNDTESWWEGKIQKIKGGFYFITFPEEGAEHAAEVVEKERLRPAYGHQPAKFDKKV